MTASRDSVKLDSEFKTNTMRMGRRHFHPLPTSLLTLFLAAPHRRTGQCFGRQLSQRGRPSSTPYNPGRKRQEWGVGFPSLWQHPASHPITNTLWLRWIISELEIPPTSLLENLLCAGLGIKKKENKGGKKHWPLLFTSSQSNGRRRNNFHILWHYTRGTLWVLWK